MKLLVKLLIFAFREVPHVPIQSHQEDRDELGAGAPLAMPFAPAFVFRTICIGSTSFPWCPTSDPAYVVAPLDQSVEGSEFPKDE
jgi:hypothetical protein